MNKNKKTQPKVEVKPKDDKIVKVSTNTHRNLKIEAAQQGVSVRELLEKQYSSKGTG